MLRKRKILERIHINEKLDNIFKYPLTVVIAAMGYGKTTTAWEYLNNSGVEFLWVFVEDDESSPQYIWDSLTRQLAKTMPEMGQQLRGLGFPNDRQQRDKVIQIIEHHTYETNRVLVIDDYHFAHSPELDSLIERIVRNNIDGFHILILTRALPKLKIDDLVLKGYCYRLKSQLFEVTETEIKNYFKLFNQDISEEFAREVNKISEGWVTAMYLIVQRYLEIGRLESGNTIERLIETTVMSRYTDEEVMLLKTLSVLDSFTPEQAIFVTENKSSAKIIQELSYENSFIHYSKEDNVFRIHNIFNDYLNKRIEEEPVKIDLKNLYKRSGIWCTDNSNILTGLKYLLKAEKYDLVLKEFEKNRITEVVDSSSKYIEKLFDHIPLDAKYRHPMGYISYVSFYVTNIDPIKGERMISEITEYYMNNEEISDSTKRHILGEIELIKSYIGFNNVSEMHKRMKESHRLLNGSSSIANKGKIITFGSPHIVYLYYKEYGKMRWTVEVLEQLFPYYSEMAGGCGVGFEYQIRAEYYLEKGNLKEAEIYAYKAMYKAETLEQVSVIICSKLTLARIFVAKGEVTKANDLMDAYRYEVEACNSPILSSAYDLCLGYLGGITGVGKWFSSWLKTGEIKNSEVLYQGMGFNYIVHGKYLLIEKKYIQLELLCEEMYQIFKPFENLLGYLHGYILDAIAKYKLYGFKAAKKSLLSAIEIGRSDGIKLPFAEYHLEIIELLENLQVEFEQDTYINDLINEVHMYALNINKNIKFVQGEPVFTKREKEVLFNIVKGKTNKDISTEMLIAEVTVEKYIAAIYRKLDVTGRVEAVKKAMVLISIENAKLYENLEQHVEERTKELKNLNTKYLQLSVTDQLTKIFNRRKLDEVLVNEFDKMNKNKCVLSIIMFDIDEFKKVNDIHGHQVGDNVLVLLTMKVQENVKTNDIFGRWGGEEFLLVCPNTPEKEAVIIANRLREMIENTFFPEVNNITCSFGVASTNGMRTVDECLINVDTALYSAKDNGRNRVELFK